ncbi:MAG TPA: hypothetical protein VMU64_01430 [Acidimicrobiales bacterium]|nr:hypothetical protein [Acidimicrobiales bacterium]
MVSRWSFTTVGTLGALSLAACLGTSACQLLVPPKVMVIMMENESASNVIGNPTLPYITSLAADYGSATASYAFGHPSLPNYLEIVSGSN